MKAVCKSGMKLIPNPSYFKKVSRPQRENPFSQPTSFRDESFRLAQFLLPAGKYVLGMNRGVLFNPRDSQDLLSTITFSNIIIFYFVRTNDLLLCLS